MNIIIQENSFSISKIISDLSKKDNVGAIVSFSGYVREFAKERQLKSMELEHYPGMTEAQIKIIIEDSFKRWKINDVLVIHRYGKLEPGEPIMMVATAAQHRKEAFEAAEFLMDYLKFRAPFWKKEVVNGKEHWVEAIAADETALSRWR